jgi:hypothetical protein
MLGSDNAARCRALRGFENESIDHIRVDLSRIFNNLLEKCGEPSSQQISTEDDRNEYGAKVGIWTTEIWRYDRGSSSAPMIVIIVNSQIRSIERGK